MSRQGLVKKRITDKRGHQRIVWVRPIEHAAAKRMKRDREEAGTDLARMRKAKSELTRIPGIGGRAKPKSTPEPEKPKSDWKPPKNARERIERRAKVMTKWRRQAPGKGVETKPTKDEVKDILEVGRFALISAGKNPKLEKDMTPEQVAERHQKLRDRLVEDGFQFTQVKGKYEEEEDSFLVWIHDADRETAVSLGKEYNQDSVIFGENGTYEAHYTTGENAGTMEEVSESWKDQTGETDYYTEVPLADGSFFKFQLPLYQDRGKESKPEKGSRREFLYGVDDVEQEEVLSRLREARKNKAS
jgi:hypothetical protein